MRPYIICHMLTSMDGRIDCSILEGVTGESDYEDTAAKLAGDAWLCGRITMQQHFAAGEFGAASGKAAGRQLPHIARKATSYAIAVDTAGKLRWQTGEINGDHLICIVSERVSSDYLDMLRSKGISYIVSGTDVVDLGKAMIELKDSFGVNRLLLEGGGHINGAFLEADLVDEVSLLLAPGIDGRSNVPAVFDGISKSDRAAVTLEMISVEPCKSGTLWIRYRVKR